MFSSSNNQILILTFFYINTTFAFSYQLFDFNSIDTNLSSNNFWLILSTSALFLITLPLYNHHSKLNFSLNISGKVRNLVDGMSQGYKYFKDTTSSRSRFVNRSNLKEYKFASKNGGFVGGIINDGNTCFMNSVLQSLASSKELMKFMDSAIEESGKEDPNTDLVFTKNLKSFLDGINGQYGDSSKEFSTRGLIRNMKNGPKQNLFSSYNQEDAQEFYQLVLSLVEKEITSHNTKVNSQSSDETSTEEDSKKDFKSKLVDFQAGMMTGLENLGSIGKVYVPAKQVDPNIPTENEHKVVGLDLITPVDGLSAERIGCLSCGEVGGIRYSVVSGLGLNLPSTNDYYYELTSLLDEWIKPEIIEDVECNRCGLLQTVEFLSEKLNDPVINDKLGVSFKARIEQIKEELTKSHIEDDIYKKLSTKQMIKKSKKSKQIFLSRPPPLLSIHINRSVFDMRTYMVRKNAADVKFYPELNLSNWVAEPSDINMDARLPFRKQDEDESPQSEPSSQDDSNTFRLSSPINDDKTIDNWNKLSPSSQQDSLSSTSGSVTPITSSDEKTDFINSSPLVYKLKAVISHFGSHNYGHYIAFRKYRGSWWRISDETVHVVSESIVLNTQGTFMLFYEYDDGEVENLVGLGESDDEEEEQSQDQVNESDDENSDDDYDDREEFQGAVGGDESEEIGNNEEIVGGNTKLFNGVKFVSDSDSSSDDDGQYDNETALEGDNNSNCADENKVFICDI